MQSRNAAWASVLFENHDILRIVLVLEAERSDAFLRVEAVEAFLSSKDTGLQAEQGAAEKLQVKRSVAFGEMRGAAQRFLTLSRIFRKLVSD